MIFIIRLVKDLKELLTAIQIGQADKMANVAKAIKLYNLTKEWMMEGDSRGRTPLHIASSYGYQNAVKIIVKENIDSIDNDFLKKQFINVTDYKGRTPIFHASAKGHFNIVQLLADRNADLDIPTNEHHQEPGSTPLMVCAGRNDSECFGILLAKRANLLATRSDGADAIYIASRYGNLNILKKVYDLNKFHQVVNRPSFRGRTPIVTAALHGHMEACRFLYSHGANLDIQDDDKCTALMYAAYEGQYFIVKFLVENGANINLRNAEGNTALMCAEANKRGKSAYYLSSRRTLVKPSNAKEKRKVRIESVRRKSVK